MNIVEELKGIMKKRLLKIRGVKNAKMIPQWDGAPKFFIKLTWFSYVFRSNTVYNQIIKEVYDSPLVDVFDEKEIFIYR